MKYLVAEKNLVGFLTAVYEYYYVHKDGCIISDAERVGLLDEAVEIEGDLSKAVKVRNGIKKLVGESGYKEIADAYRNCDAEKEGKIFEFLNLLFSHGRAVFNMYSEPSVIAFNDLIKKVRYEVHRLEGFLRFQQLESGVYYAYFGSDNDILELLLPHFKSRFNDQQFVIHDIKRKKLAVYDGKKIETFVAPEKIHIDFSAGEEVFSRLWKEYFNNVSIQNRKNHRLQRQYAPVKYRWFMNEF
jgi:probable DNA metabolism protein